MKYFLIAVLLIIIIIYTIIDRISYLYFNNDNKNNNDKLKDNTIIIYNNENDKFNYIPINSNFNSDIKLTPKNDVKIKDDNEDKYYPIEKLLDKEKNKDNDVIENDIFIKYSSIRNKLNTNEDYVKFYEYIDTIRDSMYISINENVIYDDNQLIEIIINDIQKTKLQYNFKKLKNIYIIKKINDNTTKLIMFYDGLIYNSKKIKFIENNFMGNTIIYKLDTKNKLFNHYLQ
jgi:hypothetical protein